MTRIASILLLAVLTFNWAGYRLVSDLLEQKADKQLEASIDKLAYDETMLFEIRVPLNAPYLSGNSTHFERYDGEIQVDGVHYKFVKRKIENGELVLLCLPNDDKTRFQNSRIEFFKLVNDLNNTDQKKDRHSGSVFKAFTTEYKQELNCWSIPSLSTMATTYFISADANLSKGTLHTLKHPPKA